MSTDAITTTPIEYVCLECEHRTMVYCLAERVDGELEVDAEPSRPADCEECDARRVFVPEATL